MLGTRLKYAVNSLDWLVHVDVQDLLERLDIDNIHQSGVDELSFSCPFGGHRHGDENPSASINTGAVHKDKATSWTCYGCKRGGNAITLYSEWANISRQQARDELKQIYAPGFVQPKGGSISVEFEERLADRANSTQESANQVPTITWEQYHDQFGVDWSEAYGAGVRGSELSDWAAYIIGRGFTPADLEEWGIGYDPRSNRVTIPICDVSGSIVGVKARYVGERKRDDRGKKIPKYLILGDRSDRRPVYGFARYQKSRHIFGLDKAFGNQAVLCEGELDVMALHCAGYSAVGTGSAALSDVQARRLRDHFETLILFFDCDPAGERTIWGFYKHDDDWRPGIVEKLEPFMTLKVVGFHRSDPAKLWAEGRTQTLSHLIRHAVPTSRLLRLRERSAMLPVGR